MEKPNIVSAEEWQQARDELLKGDEPAGLPLELLQSDVFDGGHAPVNPAARAATAGWLLAVAQSQADATAVDPPDEATIETNDSKVRVRESGPEPTDLAALRRDLEAHEPRP